MIILWILLSEPFILLLCIMASYSVSPPGEGGGWWEEKERKVEGKKVGEVGKEGDGWRREMGGGEGGRRHRRGEGEGK